MANRQERRQRKRAKARVFDHGDHLNVIYGTGQVAEVRSHQLDGDIPMPPAGEHLWSMLAVWRMANPAEAFDPDVKKFLDLENLISVVGPGCYLCEQGYTPEIAAAPCPGEAPDRG